MSCIFPSDVLWIVPIFVCYMFLYHYGFFLVFLDTNQLLKIKKTLVVVKVNVLLYTSFVYCCLGDCGRGWAPSLPGPERCRGRDEPIIIGLTTPLPTDAQHYLRREELHNHIPAPHGAAPGLRQKGQVEDSKTYTDSLVSMITAIMQYINIELVRTICYKHSQKLKTNKIYIIKQWYSYYPWSCSRGLSTRKG